MKRGSQLTVVRRYEPDTTMQMKARSALLRIPVSLVDESDVQGALVAPDKQAPGGRLADGGGT